MSLSACIFKSCFCIHFYKTFFVQFRTTLVDMSIKLKTYFSILLFINYGFSLLKRRSIKIRQVFKTSLMTSCFMKSCPLYVENFRWHFEEKTLKTKNYKRTVSVHKRRPGKTTLKHIKLKKDLLDLLCSRVAQICMEKIWGSKSAVYEAVQN